MLSDLLKCSQDLILDDEFVCVVDAKTPILVYVMRNIAVFLGRLHMRGNSAAPRCETDVISLADEANIFGSVGFYFRDNRLSRQTFVRLGGTDVSGFLLAGEEGTAK